MFYDATPAMLKSDIDKIAVPVFAIDRGAGGRYTIVAVNEALTEATGLRHDAVCGATPHDVLDRGLDADAVVGRYRNAFEGAAARSYRESIEFGGVAMTFDTTLHPVATAGATGHDRLIGTALRIADPLPDSTDLQWFLAQSEAALLTLAEIIQYSEGGPGVGGQQQAALAMLVRTARTSLDQLRMFGEGPNEARQLLNKSGIPPETKDAT